MRSKATANSAPSLILASASPRRRQVISALGVPFTFVVPDIDEKNTNAQDITPELLARTLALSKAKDVHKRHPGSNVLGADTIVSLDGAVLGKPDEPDDARQMLRSIRGRTHIVVTGIALISQREEAPLVEHTTTKVTMRCYTDDEIDRYIASGDPVDKAGAYAIQNLDFHPAAKVDGCYWNVVGLPSCTLVEMLRRAGFPITPDSKIASGCGYQACPLKTV